MSLGEEAGLALSLVKEVTCPLCSSLFEDPVRLDCEHNYCRQCIINYWKEGCSSEGKLEEKNGQGFTCPLCREIFPQFSLKSNKLLATIAGRVRDLGLRENSTKTPAVSREGDRGLCPVHQEPMKMYCMEEKMAICVVCAVSKEHRAHSLAPMDEILLQCVESFHAAVKSFEERMDKTEKLHKKRDAEIQEIKRQSVSLQAHIVQEMCSLQQCIQREQERLCEQLRRDTARLLALRQSSATYVSQHMSSLQEEVASIRQRLGQEGHTPSPLVKDIQELIARLRAEPEANVEDVEQGFDLALYKGPIQYMVWKKLEKVIQPGLCWLTFDPDTANQFLCLSDDLTCAQYSHTPTEGLSPCEARFEFSPCVVASSSFSSGRHYWEVDVGDRADWDVGVATETAERAGWVVLSPENGYWTVGNKKARRVGLYLDYEAGQLSFYNTEDMSPLFSFLGENFNEKLYPFFYPSADSRAQPLRILNSL